MLRDGYSFYRSLAFALIEENNSFEMPTDEGWQKLTEEEKVVSVATKQRFDAFFEKLARGSMLREADRAKLEELKQVCSFLF